MTSTITIPYAELRRLIEIARPHTLANNSIPVFTQVRLQSNGGVVEAMATDRYSAVWVAGKAAFPEGLAFGLAAKDWRNLLSLYRPKGRSDVTLTLTVDSGRVTVERSVGTLFGPSDIRVSYEIVEGAWPGIRHLRTGFSAPSKRSADSVLLNPQLLARLPLDNSTLFFPGNPGEPSWVIGEDYCVVIMGMRRGDQHAGWLERWEGSPSAPEAVSA